jgi:hypothetical protein
MVDFQKSLNPDFDYPAARHPFGAFCRIIFLKQFAFFELSVKEERYLSCITEIFSLYFPKIDAVMLPKHFYSSKKILSSL